jgi:hypothetical protein
MCNKILPKMKERRKKFKHKKPKTKHRKKDIYILGIKIFFRTEVLPFFLMLLKNAFFYAFAIGIIPTIFGVIGFVFFWHDSVNTAHRQTGLSTGMLGLFQWVAFVLLLILLLILVGKLYKQITALYKKITKHIMQLGTNELKKLLKA